MEEIREDRKRETVSVNEVLKAIERGIQAFSAFVTVDNFNKKPWWKLRTSLIWTYPPVEDAKDLPLLRGLIQKLRKVKPMSINLCTKNDV